MILNCFETANVAPCLWLLATLHNILHWYQVLSGLVVFHYSLQLLVFRTNSFFFFLCYIYSKLLTSQRYITYNIYYSSFLIFHRFLSLRHLQKLIYYLSSFPAYVIYVFFNLLYLISSNQHAVYSLLLSAAYQFFCFQ